MFSRFNSFTSQKFTFCLFFRQVVVTFQLGMIGALAVPLVEPAPENGHQMAEKDAMSKLRPSDATPCLVQVFNFFLRTERIIYVHHFTIYDLEIPCNPLVTNYSYIYEVDGLWSEWEPWTPCSEFCAGGKTFRQRDCTNPEPSHDGLDCVGKRHEQETCNTQTCRGKLIIYIFLKYYVHSDN